jgi:hypothetical protein
MDASASATFARKEERRGLSVGVRVAFRFDDEK